MSALAAGPIPKADMSVSPPPQTLVGSGDIERFRMQRQATLGNANAAKTRSPLADDFSISPAALGKANAGLGQMSGESATKSTGAEQKMPWEMPEGGQVISAAGQRSPSINAFAATMPDIQPKVAPVEPVFVGNRSRAAVVDPSVEQESAALSFFNNTGDTSNRTTIGTPNPNTGRGLADNDNTAVLDPQSIMAKVQARREASATPGLTAKTAEAPAVQPPRMGMG